VVILSARNTSEDKVRALRLGADDYMTKPFWPEELLERVRARLRRPRIERAEVIALGPLCHRPRGPRAVA
jgi:DNA-binding response OmpR family regulator